jgi:chorismate mutase
MSTASTTSPPAVARPASGSAPADATADLLDTLRGQIDALDVAITRLVAERTQLSRRAQQARISVGGTRVELGRERVIMDHYRSALGAEGPNLAEAVLRVGRGHR